MDKSYTSGNELSSVVIGSNGLPGSTQRDSCRVKFLGVDISNLNKTTQFIVASCGVLFFYVVYGYVLEAIFVQPAIKSHGLYLTFLQFVLYSIFSFIESRLERHTVRRIPIRTYAAIAFLTVATMTFSNTSLEYLNYPTQVIFKSCKLIPVLVGGILIQGKKYGPNDFVAAVVMCVGLIWFTLVDVAVSPNFHPIGVLMITLALMADAVIGNVQEKAMKRYGAPNCEVVLYSYSIGLAYLAVALLVTNQLVPGIQAGCEYPTELYGYGFLLSLAGYLGVNMVLTLVRVAGAYAAVTVTTCRKAISVAISFLAFSKPFSIQYVLSGMLVLLGVHLNVSSKQKSSSTASWTLQSLVSLANLWYSKIYESAKYSLIPLLFRRRKMSSGANKAAIYV